VITPAQLREGLLFAAGNGELVKVSTVYDANTISAQVMLPPPPRTLVRFYDAADVAGWTEPGDALLAAYAAAYGPASGGA
jgi:hypothetical protein